MISSLILHHRYHIIDDRSIFDIASKVGMHI